MQCSNKQLAPAEGFIFANAVLPCLRADEWHGRAL
jgi:hypothetical protein